MSIHVPEQFRVRIGRLGTDKSCGNNGAFIVPSPIPSHTLIVIASDGSEWEESGLEGMPWEHVSVHCENGKKQRTPTWLEISFIKDLFWDDEDVVIQFHPAKSKYINMHPNTLHLWRPVNLKLPMPPIETV